jgi:hypothetical protein
MVVVLPFRLAVHSSICTTRAARNRVPFVIVVRLFTWDKSETIFVDAIDAHCPWSAVFLRSNLINRDDFWDQVEELAVQQLAALGGESSMSWIAVSKTVVTHSLHTECFSQVTAPSPTGSSSPQMQHS